jgi:scyllo-inositol 2-dehydrogenase (NADP+)
LALDSPDASFQANVIEAVEGLELAAIVQRSGTRRRGFSPREDRALGRGLLEDTSIRLVVVATPNATHLPIARQCLLADRDVVIDKPFA